MTDQEIVQELLSHDNAVTHRFFFKDCRPLLLSILRNVFPYPVNYEECVNALYEYLMENNAAKLRSFSFRCSLFQWMKVVATRFFIAHRNAMIQEFSNEPETPVKEDISSDAGRIMSDRMDALMLLNMLPNKRYADALRHLILNDEDPESYAKSIGTSVDNIYNIKKRAISALAKIAYKYYSYGY
ncbi:MAG: sigma-70 family RNA polymerase sigma factor [Muribaculaceae bacterium]|nr:sigma-70 family RNA polymerase sigma factor [Muribaculaceae bacterium]